MNQYKYILSVSYTHLDVYKRQEKDYAKASELYTKAMAQNGRDADYAQFQKSTLLGLQGKSAEQAEMLLEIIAQKNPESKYKYEAH